MARRSTRSATLTGTAKIDRRTKDLVKRLQPGDIAVINHRDLDRVAADGLVGAGVAAVINAGESISGRYPNGGPIRVVQAGIPLVDRAGEDVLDRVHEGEQLRVDGGEVWRGEELIATGESLSAEGIQTAMDAARLAIGGELERFAVNTLEYIQREAKLTFEPVELPPIKTQFRGHHALVVVRGHDYRTDLAALRPYIREFQPVLIGVDGGADALLEMRMKPDIIIGDFDSVSEAALGTGAELIHHVHLDGRAPGRDALQRWGVPYHEFVVDGTSEDVAMLLAYEAGAQLIVAVGTHASMVEFLDKGRKGMSSTFLTRLRLGPALVDAKGVNRLYEGRVRRRDIALLVGSAIVALIVVSIVSESIHVFLRGVELSLRDFWFSITDKF
ncbi:MAG TPA: putative cytokinetic ring protein SteA [Acidimicrobiia bacterium]|nr:putative cytokinetic ring protein SteA [Acidimicrobiia bacterium]